MKVVIADISHIKYAQDICDTIAESAQVRGTGIARRTPEYISSKIENGNAGIAVDGEKFAGFCYIEKWGSFQYPRLGLNPPSSRRERFSAKNRVMILSFQNVSRPKGSKAHILEG